MFSKLNQAGWYWLMLFVLASVMEAVGLYHQYVLDEWPCVLCIHVRIWLLALMIVSILGFIVRKHPVPAKVFTIGVLAVALGLMERSWILLGVERGTIFGACSMDSGLPAWFALDKWLPLLFEVQAPCGYTPEVAFGISMAEGLVLISGLLMIISLLPLLFALWPKQRH